MDIRSLQSLMEINALQTLGAVQSYANSNSTSSMFNEIMMGLMENESMVQTLSGQSQSFLNQSLNYNWAAPVYVPSGVNTTSPVSADGDWSDVINEAARKFNVPAKLIQSVIQQESSYNPQAVSQAGAAGLMQLMPGTAKFLGVEDRFDPVQNVMGGAKYLRQMLDQFDDRMDLALAAYNAGPGNVKKYGGIPPFKETQNYVKKVLSTFLG